MIKEYERLYKEDVNNARCVIESSYAGYENTAEKMDISPGDKIFLLSFVHYSALESEIAGLNTANLNCRTTAGWMERGLSYESGKCHCMQMYSAFR